MNGTSINPIIVADEEVDDLYHVYERVSPVGLQNDEKETQYAEPKLAPASLPVEPIAKEGEEAVTGAERHDELTWSFDDFLNTTATVGLFRSGTTVVASSMPQAPQHPAQGILQEASMQTDIPSLGSSMQSTDAPATPLSQSSTTLRSESETNGANNDIPATEEFGVVPDLYGNLLDDNRPPSPGIQAPF
jgi:hypothetical protein